MMTAVGVDEVEQHHGPVLQCGMDSAVAGQYGQVWIWPCQGLDSVGRWQRAREAGVQACMGSRKVRARLVGHWQQDITSDPREAPCDKPGEALASGSKT